MLNSVRQVISLLLSFSLFVATPAPVFALPASATTTNAQPDLNLKGMQAQDPLFKEFADARWAPPKYGPFDAKDPVLDQDPYFMRSQQYTSVFGHANNDQSAYRMVRGGIQIHIPGTSRALEINQPLAPLFELEHFIFFQANDRSLFTDKASSEESYGEGLFFIDKRIVETELAKRGDSRPVPVFFFPLNGKGWTGEVNALLLEPTAVVALRNASGESDTMELQHIYQTARLEQNNLILLSVLALKHNPSAIEFLRAHWQGKDGSQIELPFVFPPRGSTAAFGAFATGLNLDNPELSLSRLSDRVTINFDFLPKAHATDFLSPDVLERLITIGMVTGTTLMASLAVQHTILKKRMFERRAYIESKADEVRVKKSLAPKDRSTLTYKVIRSLGESVDVFSHGLATVSSGIGTTAGYLIEYGADRFFKKSGSSPNGLIRRFLEYTFLYGRKQNEFIGANWMSFFLGVIILGGIDTMGVVIQLMFISPIFFPWAAQAFGSDIHDRVSSQFSGAHVENNNVVTSEMLRNFTGYFVSGSYQYSASQRQALMEIVRPDVEKQLAKEGLDPADPQNHKELTRRIEARLESMLVERGLPTRKEFLFSGPSVFRTLMKMLGYHVDRKRLATSADFKGEENESFLLERARWGLTEHALKKALQAMLDLAKTGSGDAQLNAAIEILRDTKAKYNVVMNALKNPLKIKEVSKEAYQVRKMLTLLSYDGEVIGGGVKYLDLWPAAKTHPEGAVIAARAFRQSLFGLVQDRPELLKPTEADLIKYEPEARAEAEKRLQNGSPEVGYNETDRVIETLEIIKEKVVATKDQNEVQKWSPAKADFLEEMQKNRAHEEALVKVHEEISGSEYENPALEAALASGHLPWINSFESPHKSVARETEPLLSENTNASAIYKAAYRKALAKTVGLNVLPDEQSELVRKADHLAEKEVEQNILTNPNWKNYGDQLDGMGKLRFLTHQYADAFLAKYVELTVSNSTVVGLTSKEQPGFFQKLRQKSLPSGNSFIGKTIRIALRMFESPMDSTAYRPGIANALRRNIPWYQDGKTNLQLTYRVMWTSTTIGFLAQYFIWQVKFPWPTAFFFLWASGFTSIVHYWLDRLMMNAGMPPMKSTSAKAVYSVIYSFLTYPTYIPFFFFYEDFDRLFYRWIGTPVASAVGPIVKTCEELLKAIF